MSEPLKETRRKIRLILAVVVLCFAGIWLVLLNSAKGLGYGGRPFSYWQAEVVPDQRPLRRFPGFHLSDEAAAVAREVGGDEVEILLQMISRPRYGLGSRVLDFAEDPKVPNGVKRYLGPIYPKSYNPALAILFFRAAGSAAAEAIPTLVEMLYDPADARWAGLALSEIGSDGIVALEKEFPLINDPIVRANIIHQLHHQAHIANFVADRMLEDPHAAVGMAAAQTLATYTAAPETAVPALIKGLKHNNAGVRMVASNGLGSFGADAASAIEPLQAALKDDHSEVRYNAEKSLQAIQASLPQTTEAESQPQPSP